MIRVDHQDVVYASEREKYEAVADEIVQLREKGQPVLVGTVSIEKSERLSELLKQRRVPHVVLNAKFHEKEAEIVAQAGRSGAVTIATNMAGRGTDIVLGGNPEAVAAHELKEIEDREEFERRLAEAARDLRGGQEEVLARRRPPHRRHRAPRVAARRQPAARPLRPAGRPRLVPLLPLARGRPDAHLRVRPPPEHHAAAGDGGGRPDRARHGLALDRARAEAGRGPQLREPQAPARVRRRHESAARGDLRHAPRDPRAARRARDHVLGLAETILDYILGRHLDAARDPAEWDLPACDIDLQEYFGLKPGTFPYAEKTREQIREELWTGLVQVYDRKESILGAEMMRTHEKFVMLQVVDQQWKDHLLAIDHLKEGIGLRGYGQRDPLIEYKKESFELFTLMKERIEDQIVQYLFKLQPVAREEEAEDVNARAAQRRGAGGDAGTRRAPANVNYSYGAAASGGQDAKVETMHRAARRSAATTRAPAARDGSTRSATGLRQGAAGA